MHILEWTRLSAAERDRALTRPAMASGARVAAGVQKIIERVRAGGDAALRALTRELDGVDQPVCAVSTRVLNEAGDRLAPALREAMQGALGNITRFHRPQVPEDLIVETAPGVVCEKKALPLAAVGFYVPGGSAPLPSSVLMMGVPAELAGCETRVMCTPPGKDGRIHPALLYAAALTGVTHVFPAGGAQAVAAMAYGTESIPRVDKIFGPGNQWVTEAKKQVALDPMGAGQDLPAGPSEVMVIADAQADPEMVAADLLSQAEHGPDSQVMLVSTSAALLERANIAVSAQLADLGRRAIAARALEASRGILVPDIETAAQVGNRYAPEHLILCVRSARELLAKIRTAGSVFIGPWAAEALGDYCSGTNHVLPTYGHARYASGLSVRDFMREMTVQEISREGLASIGPWAAAMAHSEGLDAHARAVEMRLERIRARATA